MLRGNIKTCNKYLQIFIIIVILNLFLIPKERLAGEWQYLLYNIIVTLLIIAITELNRKKRIKSWEQKIPGKFSHILKFVLFFGLPFAVVSVIISYERIGMGLIFSILFIVIPDLLIYGLIGWIDWIACNKMYIENKYKVTLQKM